MAEEYTKEQHSRLRAKPINKAHIMGNVSYVYSNQLQKIIYEELFDCLIQFFGILNALSYFSHSI